MDEAIAGSAATACDCDDGNQFSRANVFGMLLTLQICQLTQPYGSLLFRGLGGFLWRVNPVSSLVEACIVFWYPSKVAYHSRSQSWVGVLERLQYTAAALLLLRATIAGESDGGLMERLLTGSFLDRDVPDPPPRPGFGGPDEGSGSSTAHGQNSPSGFVRRRTTEPEANMPPGAHGPESRWTSEDAATEKSRILNQALGSNALARRESRIDLVAGISVLLVMLKLVAIQHGSRMFTTLCLLMIAGWAAIQILLLLLHSRSMDEIDMAIVVRTTRTLNHSLAGAEDNWLYLYMAFHLPFFGYPSYLFAFGDWDPQSHSGFLHVLLTVWYAVVYVVSSFAFVILWPSLIFGWIALLTGSLDNTSKYFWKRLLLFIFWLFPMTTAMVFSTVHFTEKAKHILGSNNIFPKIGAKDFYIFQFLLDYDIPGLQFLFHDVFDHVSSVLLFALALGLMVFLYSFLFVPWPTKIDPPRSLRVWASIGNTLFGGAAFLFVLLCYDPQNTYQPDWTEWLG
ncbi:hypothetical protein B0T26DRAFT_710020 [Lasiosphaeria miniovina]|uniref:Transmembrane protein n=1 Tax=Lasiosphaeria miniovina TaxID=1954250 RepID=A0AA40AKF0_9PEZI|nr:uncharacterized protein B0T26DRAFT_710020 [Lasiosphaeria miniovina]KAK0717482.1 hypothetical protein B0T26DRAFT_710020 [Lasiosphaeria miniovina]